MPKEKRSWSKLPKWVQEDLRHITKMLAKANQDCSDMHESRQTTFVRCHKCGRLHDRGYMCPYCGHDNSQGKEGIYAKDIS